MRLKKQLNEHRQDFQRNAAPALISIRAITTGRAITKELTQWCLLLSIACSISWAQTPAALPSAVSSTTASIADKTAQTPVERRLPAVQAMRLGDTEKITLDGKLDEPLWQRAMAIKDFFEYRPRDGVEAKFRSEARIVYDQNALYIGLTAFDPDPANIDAPLVRRDQVFGSQDFFAIHIDPIGTRKFAQIFRVSASGSIGDGLFNEDTGNEDFSPDFEWETLTQRTATGWTAEVKIPFSTLRYSQPASENWSIMIIRGSGRDQIYRFANAQISRDQNCLMCYAQTLSGMKDLPRGRELTFTPQLTFRRATDKTNAVGSKINSAGKSDFIAGADVKFRPRADMVFDATVNPDFSQVELDTPQLASNAQFALFFPEKRPFFLEGADILSSPFTAIYTRSITDPGWGARLTQRNNGTDFILLTTRDDGKGLILLPGPLNTNFATQDSKSQVTIGRGRLDLGTWSVGGLVSDRTYDTPDGKQPMYNRVGGADFVWRPTGETRVRGQVLVSTTRDERNTRLIAPGTPKSDEAALLDYNYNDAKWGLSGGLEHVGRGFRNDNGFFSQAAYDNAYQNIQYKWRDLGPFIEIVPQLHVGQKNDADGRILEQQVNPAVFLSLPRNTGIYIEARPHNLVRFQQNGAPLKRNQLYMNIESNPGRVLTYAFAELTLGDRGDVANNRIGNGYSFTATATIRLTDRWEIEPRIDNSVINLIEPVSAGSKRILQERAVQLKSIYHFTARDTLRIIGQYNGVRRSPSLYKTSVSPFEKNEIASIVYGHQRGLGTNFYLGITQSRTVDADNAGSGFTRKQTEIFAKWSWAFDLATLL